VVPALNELPLTGLEIATAGGKSARSSHSAKLKMAVLEVLRVLLVTANPRYSLGVMAMVWDAIRSSSFRLAPIRRENHCPLRKIWRSWGTFADTGLLAEMGPLLAALFRRISSPAGFRPMNMHLAPGVRLSRIMIPAKAPGSGLPMVSTRARIRQLPIAGSRCRNWKASAAP